MSSEKGAAEVRGAFSSTMEVGFGGWRAVTVCGCLLRSLLGLILSVTAGGTDRVGGQSRKSMELLETILSLRTLPTLTQLSGLSPALYTSA